MTFDDIANDERFRYVATELAQIYWFRHLLRSTELDCLVAPDGPEEKEKARELWQELRTYFTPECPHWRIRAFVRELYPEPFVCSETTDESK